jgi:hypothetical protein
MDPQELERLAAASRLGPNAIPGPDGVMGTADDGQGEPIGAAGVQQRLDAYNEGQQQGQQQQQQQQQPGAPGQPGQQGGQQGGIPGDADGDGTLTPDEANQLDGAGMSQLAEHPQAQQIAQQQYQNNPPFAEKIDNINMMLGMGTEPAELAPMIMQQMPGLSQSAAMKLIQIAQQLA